MEFFQNAIKEKLEEIERERIQWTKHKDIHLEAEKNLQEFPKSFQLDCLVPIGTKALMPGKLYHTNEIMIGHQTGLFSHCSAHKALEICKHRLKLADDRLKALDVEQQMYNDRLELPFAEAAAFGDHANQREIIETCTDEEDLRWRELHKQRVAEHKKREAIERTAINDDDKDYMSILDRAELLEELEDELENMDVENDNDLRARIDELIAAEPNEQNSHTTNVTDDDSETDSIESDTESSEFVEFKRSVKNMTPADELKAYKAKLREVNDYLAQKKVKTTNDLNEKLDKSAFKECLQSAIHRMQDVAEVPKQPEQNGHKPLDNGDAPSHNEHVENHLADTYAYLNRTNFVQLEKQYANRSNGEQLVFYKSQLRGAIKLIASSSPNISPDESMERRLLYEYISGRIDQLRADILKEKQAQMEERFVDDNSDNEENRLMDDDNGHAMDDDNESDSRSNDDDSDNDGNELSIANKGGSGKRRISFANQPTVTTYNLDDEPWCIQTSNAENMKALMDKTFNFFNDDYDDDGDGDKAADNCIEDDSDDRSVPTTVAAPISNDTLSSAAATDDDGCTLHITFEHTPQKPWPINRHATTNTIQTPADIYDILANETNNMPLSSPTHQDRLKSFVLNVANMDVENITERMNQMYAQKRNDNQDVGVQPQRQQLPNNSAIDDCDETNGVQKLSLPDVNTIKSILKNKEAVSMETHRDRTLAMDEHDEVYENHDERNTFVGFDTIVGDIVENPAMALNNISDMANNGCSQQPTNSIGRDKPVSLFKRSRRQ